MADKTTKEKIIEYLESKDLYNVIDDILIDELVFSIDLAQLSKDDIDLNGVVIMRNGIAGYPNPAVTSYLNASKQVLNILRRLGIDARSRIELKLNIEVESDGFDS